MNFFTRIAATYYIIAVEPGSSLGKLVFKRTKAKPFTYVWRLENTLGKGPYNDNDEKWMSSPHDGSKHPTPEASFPNRDLEFFESYSGIVRFGFKDKNSLNKWFTKEELEKLAKQGFSPQKKKASHVWEGAKQVFYVPFNEKKPYGLSGSDLFEDW